MKIKIEITLSVYYLKITMLIIKSVPLLKAIYIGVDIEGSLRSFLNKYCIDRFVELYQMEIDKSKGEMISKRIL